MKTIGIIPARYGSSRLPGKPLKLICGKPMIQHVYEQGMKAKTLDSVVVATDDRRIVEAVQAFGGKAFLTSVEHKTGSDRIAEVARNMACDIVVNIQGDEPLISPEIIDEFVSEMYEDSSLVMVTGCHRIQDASLLENPNVVKVVSDLHGYALLFSRSLIPYPRYAQQFAAFEHIGIYVYQKDFLMKYITLEDTPLASTESLEQMKVLEHGYKIKLVKTKFPYDALSVDTQEDLEMVERIMLARGGM
ncbi:MAG: 3-deoxy-manno-octulosonate cytidylyltransferase [Sphaerochaetaceae bacterium]|jgi:3-deoxy-manno-octulosonate cytidylyltransferase (CMP-KDO synthetase)|nr:3-deoxy-manno-octulosonate cytidylyltransferase [Sphaerochaetaceae bacterium]MDX9809761.1 3-deoxy-manno-octulosonate cytidylyltransferase [Sphaerochaetaceae bacterium]